MIDVSPAINRLSKSATLSSRASGTYDAGGNFVPGALTSGTIQATIMQINPAELRDLPEGIRDEAKAVCWTVSNIRNDDTVTQGGIPYRVLMVSDRRIGNYYRAVLGRTNDEH